MTKEPEHRYESGAAERVLPVDHAPAQELMKGVARTGAGTSGDARGSAGTIPGTPGGAGTSRQSVGK